MRPLNGLTSDNLLFGSSDSRRRLGILLACFGAALAVAAVALPNLPRQTVLHLTECGAMLGIAGLFAATWVEELWVDLRTREFSYRKGLTRFCRRAHGRLDIFDRVTLSLVPATNLYGEEEIRGIVRLRSITQALNMCIHASEADARVLALKMGGAIGKEVEHVPRSCNSGWAGQLVKRGAAWSVWAGMLAVFATVAWTASHGRHGHEGTASFSNNQPSGAYYAYEHGTALYRNGDFKGAEHFLKQAIKEMPLYPDAYNDLAYAFADQNKLKDALEAARMALSQSPNTGNILDTVAEMHQPSPEFKEAAGY